MFVSIYRKPSGTEFAVLEPVRAKPVEWTRFGGFGVLVVSRPASLSELAEGRKRLSKSGKTGLVLWER